MTRLAVLIALAGLAAAPVWAAGWPPLPADRYVSGRASTPDDVKAGRAVCTYDHIFFDNGEERLPGEPVPGIEVPQYAWFTQDPSADEPVREPVILIQAERWGEGAGAGIIRTDGALRCEDFTTLELLGRDPANLPTLD